MYLNAQQTTYTGAWNIFVQVLVSCGYMRMCYRFRENPGSQGQENSGLDIWLMVVALWTSKQVSRLSEAVLSTRKHSVKRSIIATEVMHPAINSALDNKYIHD